MVFLRGSILTGLLLRLLNSKMGNVSLLHITVESIADVLKVLIYPQVVPLLQRLKALLSCLQQLLRCRKCNLKGPMSWGFLLIIFPLLRSTKIDLYCAMFQTHIGFSYSISV